MDAIPMERAKSRRKPGQEQDGPAHVPLSICRRLLSSWQAVWVDACSSLSARRVRVSPAPSPIAPLSPTPSLKLDGALGGEGPSPRHHVPQLQRAKRPQTFQVQPRFTIPTCPTRLDPGGMHCPSQRNGPRPDSPCGGHPSPSPPPPVSEGPYPSGSPVRWPCDAGQAEPRAGGA